MRIKDLNVQDPITFYFKLHHDLTLDSLQSKAYDDRINQLERVVYAEDIVSLSDLVKTKLNEFSNTFNRIISKSIDEPVEAINSYSRKVRCMRTKHREIMPLRRQIKSNHITYIDITCFITVNYVTGIQRVVSNLLLNAGDFPIIPVFNHDGRLYYYDLESDDVHVVKLKMGDRYFIADSNWENLSPMRIALDLMAELGVHRIAMIYDVLPLEFPIAFDPITSSKFYNWFYSEALKCDTLICISNAVAKSVSRILDREIGPDVRRPKIEVAPLGANIGSHLNREASKHITNFIDATDSFFLSVGTIEPRKGYGVSLDAFEMLWLREFNISYVIVGKYGWLSKSLETRILNHSEFNKRLFWWNNIDDVDLGHLYSNARALVLPSVAEGYGLPIVEAANYGTPTICSNIEVFKEIGGVECMYFDVANSASLASIIQKTIQLPKKSPAIDSIEWAAATKNIYSILEY